MDPRRTSAARLQRLVGMASRTLLLVAALTACIAPLAAPTQTALATHELATPTPTPTRTVGNPPGSGSSQPPMPPGVPAYESSQSQYPIRPYATYAATGPYSGNPAPGQHGMPSGYGPYPTPTPGYGSQQGQYPAQPGGYPGQQGTVPGGTYPYPSSGNAGQQSYYPEQTNAYPGPQSGYPGQQSVQSGQSSGYGNQPSGSVGSQSVGSSPGYGVAPGAADATFPGGQPSYAGPQTATAPVTGVADPCYGDEQISLSPLSPRVGNELLIVVTSARPHPFGRLAGTEPTRFVRERPGQSGYVWEWTVEPTYPGEHEYTFYVDSTLPCKSIKVRVQQSLATRTPTPYGWNNGNDNR